MFRDGRRKIDMILCYEEESEGVMTELEAKKREARRTFLENLVKDGLELEIEDKALAFDEKTCFVKIHLPWRSEMRYAEVLNLKLPVKRFITISVKAWVKECLNFSKFIQTNIIGSLLNYFLAFPSAHMKSTKFCLFVLKLLNLLRTLTSIRNTNGRGSRNFEQMGNGTSELSRFKVNSFFHRMMTKIRCSSPILGGNS